VTLSLFSYAPFIKTLRSFFPWMYKFPFRFCILLGGGKLLSLTSGSPSCFATSLFSLERFFPTFDGFVTPQILPMDPSRSHHPGSDLYINPLSAGLVGLRSATRPLKIPPPSFFELEYVIPPFLCNHPPLAVPQRITFSRKWPT